MSTWALLSGTVPGTTSLWSSFLMSCYLPPIIESAFGNWLAGFTAGEGCFEIRDRRHPKFRTTYSPTFTLSLREDDVDILREVKRRIGYGCLYRFTEKKYPNKKPMYRWRVQDKKGLLTLRSLFLSYPLRAKKLRDFLIWEQAVNIYCNQEPSCRKELPLLKKQLEEQRKYENSILLVSS